MWYFCAQNDITWEKVSHGTSICPSETISFSLQRLLQKQTQWTLNSYTWNQQSHRVFWPVSTPWRPATSPETFYIGRSEWVNKCQIPHWHKSVNHLHKYTPDQPRLALLKNNIMQKQSDPIVSTDSCPQDKRVSGFQRFYHVTEPFIKRLGLETELQVSDSRCLQTAILLVYHLIYCMHPKETQFKKKNIYDDDEEIQFNAQVVQVVFFFIAGPHWLCKLPGMERTRRVSFNCCKS